MIPDLIIRSSSVRARPAPLVVIDSFSHLTSAKPVKVDTLLTQFAVLLASRPGSGGPPSVQKCPLHFEGISPSCLLCGHPQVSELP